MNIGTSPSGKAAGFGPAISEVRILPPQPIDSPKGGFFVGELHKAVIQPGSVSHLGGSDSFPSRPIDSPKGGFLLVKIVA